MWLGVILDFFVFIWKPKSIGWMQLAGRGQNDRKFWTNWKKHGSSQLRCLPRWNEAANRIHSAIPCRSCTSCCVQINIQASIDDFYPQVKISLSRANGFRNLSEMAELIISSNSIWILQNWLNLAGRREARRSEAEDNDHLLGTGAAGWWISGLEKSWEFWSPIDALWASISSTSSTVLKTSKILRPPTFAAKCSGWRSDLKHQMNFPFSHQYCAARRSNKNHTKCRDWEDLRSGL